MKSFVLLSVILFATLVIACNKDYQTVTIFYVKNVSNHNVKLTVFNAELQQLGQYKDTMYLLSNNSEIEYEHVGKGKNSPSRFPFGSSADSDSTYIIFDDSLKIVYRRTDSNPRNILDINSYVGGKEKKGLYEYRYSITEEDYKKAI